MNLPRWNRQAVRDFFTALALLTLALASALAGSSAAARGDTFVAVVGSVLALVLATYISLTIVPRLARRVAIGRWLLPISFGITREGGFYILGIFLLGLAAVNTGNNLLFLIISALLAAIVISGIVARASLRAVSVSVDVPENIFEREHIALKVSLRNQKRLFPSFSIQVEDAARDLDANGRRRRFWRRAADGPARECVLRRAAYFPLVPARQTCSEVVTQTFPRRGSYSLDGFELSTRFPFGFFRRGERMHASGEVVVYPAVEDVSSQFHLLPFLPGRLEGVHLGQGESLYAIRKYQEGESARIVDWKASAKTGVLMAREYARDAETKFCLILDTLIPQPAPAGGAERFEKAVSLAASLAAHFADEGAELEILTPYQYVPRGMGKPQLYRMLKVLALVESEPAPAGVSSDLRGELSGILDPETLQEILSDKIFKIVITAKPRGSFPATIWRSSRVVYFDEL